MDEDLILDNNLRIPKPAGLESAKEIMRLKTRYAQLHKKVKGGKIALWVMLGYSVLGMLWETYQTGGDTLILAINGVYIGLIVTCVILVEKKKIFIGLLAATILFVLVHFLIALGEPLMIIKGILIKGLIIYYLIVGLLAVKEYKKTLVGIEEYDINVDGL